ncbi:MAG: hypothetical protein C3F13_11600 [Anaerolineales bacterium]|nr:MAG: hypothetical protein C3F13_11600 [Anaerolineales bacterium]
MKVAVGVSVGVEVDVSVGVAVGVLVGVGEGVMVGVFVGVGVLEALARPLWGAIRTSGPVSNVVTKAPVAGDTRALVRTTIMPRIRNHQR